MKTLKIWNGRDWYCKGHLYVCAHSRAEAIRIVNAAYRCIRGLKLRDDVNIITVNEARDYWVEGCWGNAMEGITPELGVWHSKDEYPEKPVRIYPENMK